jgi:carboxyl-terminal processing protease
MQHVRYVTLLQMERGYFSKNGIVMRGISFALVAALGFAAGLSAGSSHGSAAAIVNRVPLIGDGLDATPNTNIDLAAFWKAWNALEGNFVITQASSSLPTDKEKLYGMISGLAESYGDPYTVFFPPEEAKAFLENISGSFGGVGMEIDVKDGILTVVAPLKGTPAEAAGIKAGDLIAAINGKSTEGLSTDKAVGQIRGPVGTTVVFTIIRDGKPLEIKVVRDTIEIPETEDGFVEGTGVYRIALYEFTSNSGTLFTRAFKRFKASGAEKLIIDLRSNPGGYLDAAVDIASHFLPRGAVVVTEDFGDKRPKQVHTSLGYMDVPRGTKVVVLIDGGSASASEIFAGALQDHDAATVVGAKSFGKGSVQTLISLEGGSLKVTIARWVTPDGHWIMDNGVTPDIVVPYTAEDAAAKKDPQLERAVQFLNTGR